MARERLNAFTFTRRSAMEPIPKAGDNHGPSHSADGDHSSLRMQSTRHHPCFGVEPCALWAQLNASNLSKAIDDLSRVFIHNNQIIGWLITFPLLDETLDYRILWMNENYRKIERDQSLNGNHSTSPLSRQPRDCHVIERFWPSMAKRILVCVPKPGDGQFCQ